MRTDIKPTSDHTHSATPIGRFIAFLQGFDGKRNILTSSPDIRGAAMSTADVLRDLVIANRILAHEGVVDAYGHISVRHPERPDRFFLSGSRSPELVTLDDIIEYDLDCNPVDLRGRAQYTERPIHGAIYRKRPDVMSVVHNHAYEVIPFTVAPSVKLRPLLHTAAGIGAELP